MRGCELPFPLFSLSFLFQNMAKKNVAIARFSWWDRGVVEEEAFEGFKEENVKGFS